MNNSRAVVMASATDNQCADRQMMGAKILMALSGLTLFRPPKRSLISHFDEIINTPLAGNLNLSSLIDERVRGPGTISEFDSLQTCEPWTAERHNGFSVSI